MWDSHAMSNSSNSSSAVSKTVDAVGLLGKTSDSAPTNIDVSWLSSRGRSGSRDNRGSQSIAFEGELDVRHERGPDENELGDGDDISSSSGLAGDGSGVAVGDA